MSKRQHVHPYYVVRRLDCGDSKALMNHSRTLADAKHVLLILEGDTAVRDSLKFSLEIEGFEVRTYAYPEQLLNDDSLPVPSCLIVHYHLPTMNGLDVVAKLRERQSSLPAILVTGRPNAHIRKRASTAGVAILETPFRGRELIECIRTILDEQSKQSS
jgi:two-component system, LuxR family, response regulator FixJ